MKRDKIDAILGEYDEWIRELSARYGIPSAAIQAILIKEMEMIDIGDTAADLVVQMNELLRRLSFNVTVFDKTDSSTGYGQIFGWVGIEIANFAVEHKLETYQSLGIHSNEMLNKENVEDVQLMWNLLHDNPRANIQFVALNLLSCAYDITGSMDFGSFAPEELQSIFSRYNSSSSAITEYGRDVYRYYMATAGMEPAEQ